MNLNDALKNLENWSQSLPISVNNTIPQIERVFLPDYVLPGNCPSKAAAALMCLRQVEKIMEELNGAMEILEKAIQKAGK